MTPSRVPLVSRANHSYQAASKCQAAFRGNQTRRQRDGDGPAATFLHRKDTRAAATRARREVAAVALLQARARGLRARHAARFTRARAMYDFAGDPAAGDLALCAGEVVLVERGDWELARVARREHESAARAAAAAAAADRTKRKPRWGGAGGGGADLGVVDREDDAEGGARWIHARRLEGGERGNIPTSYVAEVERPPDWVLAIRERNGHPLDEDDDGYDSELR